MSRRFKENINSIGLAVFLSANPLSWLFSFSNIIVIVCLISFVILIANNNPKKFFNNKLLIIPFILLLFFFTYSFFSFNDSIFILYFTSFLTFGVTGLLYSSCEFNYSTFYKSIFIIAIIIIPSILKIDDMSFDNQIEASGYYMGTSYGALRLLLGVILLLPFLKSNYSKIFSIGIIIVYFIFYTKYGNRGAFLALMIFFLLIFLEKRKLLRFNMMFLICVLSYLTSYLFADTIIFIKELLDNLNFNIKALDKIILINQNQEDLSNGRVALLNTAFKDISDNLLFGNGIAVYEAKYGIYPHNVFVQILYEGGLLFLIPILYVFLIFFKFLISKNYSFEEKKFLVYIFSAGIIELLFSNVHWRSVFFWYFIGIVLHKRKKLYNA